MDAKRKKQLMEEYKNRRPEMGVISFKCKKTGEAFLGASTDTRADFNSNRAKLDFNSHPNKYMQKLWNEYGGINGFEFSVIEILKYENPNDNHREELEELREICLADNSKARRIWR